MAVTVKLELDISEDIEGIVEEEPVSWIVLCSKAFVFLLGLLQLFQQLVNDELSVVSQHKENPFVMECRYL